MIRARSVLLRSANPPRRRRAAIVSAAVVVAAGAVTWVVGGGEAKTLGSHLLLRSARVASSPSPSPATAGAMSSGPVLVPPPSTGTGTLTWNWRAHPGMGSTRVSGPVTHPMADHAGAGLERLGKTREVFTMGSSALRAASSAPRGMDVSAYQPNISWSRARANGASFAYMKATEGIGYVSSTFGSQYTGSYNAGLIRGAYHFALPDRSSGAAQADYFIRRGGGWSTDGWTLPGALDIEYNPYGSECYGFSRSRMVSWISSFVNEYQARTSRWPVIYSTTDWWRTCTGNSGAFGANDPLWIACYCGSAGTLPAGWSTHTIWQYADSGTFPGDQDVFNGNYRGLQRLAAGTGSNPAAVVGNAGTIRVYVRGTSRGAYENRLPDGGRWSGLNGIGGTLPANLSVLASATGPIDVFGVGTNGRLYADVLTGGTWSGWRDIGGVSGGLQGRPAVVQEHGGKIRVYARGANGNLYEEHLTPGGRWSGFWNMGGQLPSDAAALVGSAGYVWVFAVGTDRALYERHLPAGGSWSGWNRLGGYVTGIPAVAQDHSGTVRVYLRGVSGNLYEAHMPQGGRWTAQWNMGGRFTDGAAALIGSSGYVWVFGVGTDQALYERHLPAGGSWSGWARVGGSVAGVPSVAQDRAGTVRVYLRGTSAGLYETHTISGGGWSRPWNMGGVLF